VNVAHKRPAHGALGAGLDFLTQNRFKTTAGSLSLWDESPDSILLGWLHALHIDNFAAKCFEHLLDGGIFFSLLAHALFLAPRDFFL
jgi:hypothetical protein